MRYFIPMVIALLMGLATPALAGETHYEVYYFHASWRCTNCTNADAWTGEAVNALRSGNPGVDIRYVPKQLETNAQLVSLMKAKRVDVAVAEVRDGRIVRHKNLGNILSLVGSKPTLQKHVMDGVVNFIQQSPGVSIQQTTPQPSASSTKKIGVYLIQTDANSRMGNLVSNTLSQYFPQLLQSQRASVQVINPQNPNSAGWLSIFNARPGEVVVALMDGNTIETFSTLPGPSSQAQESSFMASFANIVQQNMSQGGL